MKHGFRWTTATVIVLFAAAGALAQGAGSGGSGTGTPSASPGGPPRATSGPETGNAGPTTTQPGTTTHAKRKHHRSHSASAPMANDAASNAMNPSQ